MSDNINVGDRVRGAFTGRSGTVIAITEQRAWIRNSGEPFTIPLCNLTRIEPEPVTLTAKYGIGDRVRSTLSGSVYRVAAIASIQYRTEEGPIIDEHNSEPVPTPCPTCKGSGKASE